MNYTNKVKKLISRIKRARHARTRMKKKAEKEFPEGMMDLPEEAPDTSYDPEEGEFIYHEGDYINPSIKKIDESKLSKSLEWGLKAGRAKGSASRELVKETTESRAKSLAVQLINKAIFGEVFSTDIDDFVREIKDLGLSLEELEEALINAFSYIGITVEFKNLYKRTKEKPEREPGYDSPSQYKFDELSWKEFIAIKFGNMVWVSQEAYRTFQEE